MSAKHQPLVCLLLLLVAAVCESKSVTSPVGTIIGHERNVELAGKQYTTDRFLGIPYAEPPIGDRRFSMPVPKADFSSPFEAKAFGAGCPQYMLPGMAIPRVMNEDCLFLNVFVPKQQPNEQSGYAVMVFIHGGGFLIGSGDVYVADTLAAYGNVIVVTLNYRLGIFGFLTNLDEHAPANLGMWDQQLALQWVHKNIQSFGGDNTRVTIFGESAGSMSCLYQAFLPENTGLFQRVIAQSGAHTLDVLKVQSASAVVDFVADTFECDKTDIVTIIACLRKFGAMEIIDKLESLGTTMDVLMKLQFFPILDGNFMKVYPGELIEAAKSAPNDEVEFFRSLDVIFGANSHEGGLYVKDMSGTEDITYFKPTPEQMLTQLLPTPIMIHTGKQPTDLVTKLVAAQYTDWSDPEGGWSLRDQYTALQGDIWFVIPTLYVARSHVNASSGRSYTYLFTPKPSAHLISTTPSWLAGANHADDLMFVFGFDEEARNRFLGDKVFPEPSQWEVDTARSMMTFWSNFAKTGDPSTSEMSWPEYDLDSQQYMEINRGHNDAKKYFYSEKANFWFNIIPEAFKVADSAPTTPVPTEGAEQGSCVADGGCDGA